MKNLIIMTLFLFGWMGLAIAQTNAQTAYTISFVRYNPEFRFVDGYSATALDYAGGFYYDPAVRGDLYRTDQNETILDSGYDEGFSSFVPAEVYLLTNNYVVGKTYCTSSLHYIRATFYLLASGEWYDPFRFNNSYAGGNPYPGTGRVEDDSIGRRFLINITLACKMIEVQPTPTPTPNPTPTPTPCNPNITGSCQVRATIVANPAVVRPSSLSGRNQTSTIKVCTQPATSGRSVTLLLATAPEYRDYGGHRAAHHSGTRPIGRIAKTNGVTGSNGCFTTLYHPSHITSQIEITARILGYNLKETMFVAVSGLANLIELDSFRLIGFTPSHPEGVSHYGTSGTNDGLRLIATDYNREYYDGEIPPFAEKIAYNDMSLTNGGKFDLRHNWLNSGPHQEHRVGINCDVRSSNIPRRRWGRMLEIFQDRGSRTLDETGSNMPHWHLRFEDALSQGNSQPFAGNALENDTVEITPHSFIEDGWEALDRSATQEEWELWHDRLVAAKSIGPVEFQAEVNSFLQNVFSLSEYAARHRTDPEFISDVFWSHLHREPTPAESANWEQYLQNLPPILSLHRKRMRMLGDFERLPEFEQLVNSIVDSNVSPEPTP